MKTTKRKLAVQWQAADQKTGAGRVAFGQRDVMVREASGMEDLIALANASSRHAEMIVDLFNSQLHIRFGSTAGKAELVAQGCTTEKEARAKWDDLSGMPVLDYLAAFDEAARRERKAAKGPFELALDSLTPDKRAKFDALTDGQKAEKKAQYLAKLAALSLLEDSEEEE